METTSGLFVSLQNVQHSFEHGDIFGPLSENFESGHQIVILGQNGSGKSTLGKIIAGQMTPSSGSVLWSDPQQSSISPDKLVQMARFAGPSTSLHPELTVEELIQFQGMFKDWRTGYSVQEFLSSAGMENHMHRPYKDLSSGMRQRVELALAMASDSPLLVLDEPCANLDELGQSWYQDRLNALHGHVTVVICSNHREEDFSSPDLVLSL